MRLLVAEDNDALRDALKGGLESVGYIVDAVPRGDAALAALRGQAYDLAILDVMMPGIDGFDVVRTIRGERSALPVLFLTAKDTVADRVQGLDLGADDYLVKPFAVEELLARVRSLIRRGKSTTTSSIRISDIVIETTTRTVHRAGRLLDLTPREYALLEYLAMRAGTIVTREELEKALFPAAPTEGSNAVDVLVGRLRKKLCPVGWEELIRTRRGYGYVMAADA